MAGGRGGLLAGEELELRAYGERAGAVVAEGLVERVLDALRFDLAESGKVLQLLRRRARYRCKALGTSTEQLDRRSKQANGCDTDPKRRPQGLDVGLVHFADVCERGA